MTKNIRFALFLFFTLIACSYASDLPDGFVYIDEIIPEIVVELRYAGNDNFLGRPVDGYESDRCIITADAAYALKRAQAALKKFGLGLKIFDAYRPQRAVDHFGRWSEDAKDTKMKQQYYPSVKKSELFDKGYLGKKSRHTKGSTVDLTLIDLDSGKEIDMGSPWDFFDEKSHGEYRNITEQQRANRLLLRFVMIEFGFYEYSKEWWHFTLVNEPFPDTVHDFVIR
jgi:D-alanyl-D-alanine dipeptidase